MKSAFRRFGLDETCPGRWAQRRVQDAASKDKETMPPLVSVIIPSFNSARYLAEAVESVFAQTYSAVECIVIDDGSTDHTGDILRELSALHPRLRVARKTNGGAAAARNMGLRMCSGSFISFLDADDVMLPGKTERLVAFLNAHPDVGLVYGDYLIVTEDLQALAAYTAEMPRGLDPLDALCYRNWFNFLGPLIRRAVAHEVGEFDEELAAAEDWDYFIRCAKVTHIAYQAGPVALYRQHGDQVHRDYFRMRRGCIQVATKSFSGNRRRLRAAMTAIELTHAKYLWRQRERMATFVSLMKVAVGVLAGADMRCIGEQLKAIGKSPLTPIRQGNLGSVLPARCCIGGGLVR